MEKHQLIVVGGGPVGLHAAAIIARAGIETLVLEEHTEIGEPVQCGGLVSRKVLNISKYNGHAHPLRGAKMHTPGGHIIEFMADEPKAYSIDRAAFDHHLAGVAKGYGADIRKSAKVVSGQRVEGKNVIEVLDQKSSKSYKLECDLLIAADGVQSSISKWFGLPRPKKLVSGYQAVFKCERPLNPDDLVSVVGGNEVAPGFFGWVIPQASDQILVGVGTMDAPKPAREYFEALLEHHAVAPIVQGAERVKDLAGCIPLGPVGRSFGDGIMSVGDAAGQVKPLSGGGLYAGLICARHCANVAVKALNEGDVTRDSLSIYHSTWQHGVGKELKNGMMIRKFFNKLTNRQMDDLAEIVNNKNLSPLIAKYGDIDSPSILAKVLLKKAPSLLKYTGTLLRALF